MSQGFYKDDNGQLIHGPNFVEHADWRLDADIPADRDRAEEGWSWFDSEEEARTVLGVPDELDEPPAP